MTQAANLQGEGEMNDAAWRSPKIAPKQFSYLRDLEARGDIDAMERYAESIGWPWRATQEQLAAWQRA